MRTVGYLFAGYMILSFAGFGLMAGGPTGFLALVVGVVGVVALVRSYRRGRDRMQKIAPYAPGYAPLDVRPLLRRLGLRTAELSARLPEDPMSSDDFVAVAHALLHEPEARADSEAEYASRRAELETQRTAVERLTRDWREDAVTDVEAAAKARRLEGELDATEEYTDGLRARARESGVAADRARETIARAEALLSEATSSLDPAPVRALLAEATAALEPGRERPLAARRHAEDALHRLERAADRAESERALPGDVHQRQEEVARRQAAVAEALARIRENLALAASRSAPACVVDIEAGEAAAAQLHQQAGRAAAAAAELIGEGDLSAAAERLSTGLGLLDQADPLVGRVEAQLADLAHAALAAREAVREAEAGTDAAWADVESSSPRGREGAEEVVQEARRLAERARAALGRPKPDWFEVRELSQRASRLVGALRPTPAETVSVSPGKLETAREAATAAREEAWALALSAYAVDTHGVRDAEAAYQEALALEAEAAADRSGEALGRAVAAFRHAERLARRAASEAEGTRPQADPAAPARTDVAASASVRAAFCD